MGTKQNIEIQVTFKNIDEADLDRYIGYNAMLAKVKAKIKAKPVNEVFSEGQLKKLQVDKEKKQPSV